MHGRRCILATSLYPCDAIREECSVSNVDRTIPVLNSRSAIALRSRIVLPVRPENVEKLALKVFDSFYNKVWQHIVSAKMFD